MKRVAAVFDGKDLVDDSLRDYEFDGFYWADDTKGSHSHMIGTVSVCNDKYCFDGIVDAQWDESNTIRIELLACPCSEDFYSMREDFFKYYEDKFKEWEEGMKENCIGDGSAEVEFRHEDNVLYVRLWWLIDE